VVTDFISIATVSLLFGTIAQNIHVGPKRARWFRPSDAGDDDRSSDERPRDRPPAE
jgi:hypothetical protein